MPHTILILALLFGVANSACPRGTQGFEVGAVEVPTLGIVQVNFKYLYDSIPVVVVVPVATIDGAEPATARIRSVSRSGFQVAIVRPPGAVVDNSKHIVNYFAMEAGTRRIGEMTVQAGTVTTGTTVANDGPKNLDSVQLNPDCFDNKPVILTSIQSDNSETGSVAQGFSSPFLTVAVDDIQPNGDGFLVGLERSETPDGAVVLPETIGYIAFESVTARVDNKQVCDGNGDIFGLSARSRPASGYQNEDGKGTKIPVDIAGRPNGPIVVASLNQRVRDGGWARLRASTQKGVAFVYVDEDTSKDKERRQNSVEVGLVAFETAAAANVRPVVSFDAPSTVDEGTDFKISVDITDPNTEDIFTLSVVWGDGSKQETKVSNTASGRQTVDLIHSYKDEGRFIVSVSVTDKCGSTVDDKLFLNSVNVAPTLNIQPFTPGHEGEEFDLVAALNDPGVGDRFTVLAQWGDGSDEKFEFGADKTPTMNPDGTQTVTLSHRYKDNSPTGFPYLVNLVTLDNSDKGRSEQQVEVAIENAPPTVTLSSTTFDALEEQEFRLPFMIEDVTADSPFDVRLDWGDGTIVTFTSRFPAGDTRVSNKKNESPTHRYSESGTYAVKLVVSDKDRASTESNATVRVGNKAPVVRLDSFTSDNNGVGELVFTVNDAATRELTGTFDWGDGNVTKEKLSVGSNTIFHQFAPSVATPTLTTTITLTVTDGELSTERKIRDVTIQTDNFKPNVRLSIENRAGGAVVRVTNNNANEIAVENLKVMLDLGDFDEVSVIASLSDGQVQPINETKALWTIDNKLRAGRSVVLHLNTGAAGVLSAHIEQDINTCPGDNNCSFGFNRNGSQLFSAALVQ